MEGPSTRVADEARLLPAEDMGGVEGEGPKADQIGVDPNPVCLRKELESPTCRRGSRGFRCGRGASSGVPGWISPASPASTPSGRFRQRVHSCRGLPGARRARRRRGRAARTTTACRRSRDSRSRGVPPSASPRVLPPFHEACQVTAGATRPVHCRLSEARRAKGPEIAKASLTRAAPKAVRRRTGSARSRTIPTVPHGLPFSSNSLITPASSPDPGASPCLTHSPDIGEKSKKASASSARLGRAAKFPAECR